MLFDSGAREKPWDRNLQLLLVGIIAFNVIPHIMSIPVWTTVIASLFLVWKVLSLYREVPRPPRGFLYLVSFGCAIGVFFEYGTILGQEAASALLVTLASAKLLETNRYRDAMFVIFTAFFLLMAHLLDSQTIFTTIYMGVDVLMITTLMFQLHKQERRQSARSFRPVMKTLLLAIPVWIFLFIVFPRFSTGVWGPSNQGAGGGSFAEDLDPGGIESLTDSDEPAFRVTFDGPLPPLSEMYWRGEILTRADGLKWSRSQEKDARGDVLVPVAEAPLVRGSAREKLSLDTSYQIFLEPRFQSWIFTLDYPTSLSAHQGHALAIRRKPGFIYENLRPSSGSIVYDGLSNRSSTPQKLLNDERNRMLQLPDELDPRIRELARRLRDEAHAMPASARFPTFADRLSDHVEDWFDTQGFRYTKQPGILKSRTGPGQLAEFLFERKRGFCEHYAASFATLMRAAGIPARVTVGFLGASKNVYANYFIVRDLDAHAWAEIWRDDPLHPGLGRWVRVDPTALIAPLRLEMGGDFNLLDPATYRKDLTQAEAELALRVHNSRLYYQAALAWDALQMKWNSFLNDYDFEFQKSFLEKIGLKEVTRGALFLFALVGVLGFALGLHVYLRKRAHKMDQALMSWRQLCRKLERAGVKRRATEGPLDFAERAALAFPAERERLMELGVQYARLRYGENADASAVREFRRAVRAFKARASILRE